MKHKFRHTHRHKSSTKSTKKTKKLSKKIGVRTYVTACTRATQLCYHVEAAEANAAIAAFPATLEEFVRTATIPDGWVGSPELMESDNLVVHHWSDTYAPEGYTVTYSNMLTPTTIIPDTLPGHPEYLLYDVHGQATFRIVRTTYHGA